MDMVGKLRHYNITPKPTLYKGIEFRSKLEARWAIFFDTLKLDWEYEKEPFRVDAHTFYLPDFWLKDWLVEIKPTPPTEEEIYKARSIGQRIAIISGTPSTVCQVMLFEDYEPVEVTLSSLEQAHCFMRGFDMWQWLSVKKLWIITGKRNFNKAFERANRI